MLVISAIEEISLTRKTETLKKKTKKKHGKETCIFSKFVNI